MFDCYNVSEIGHFYIILSGEYIFLSPIISNENMKKKKTNNILFESDEFTDYLNI